jgi:DNA-binding response OmpR family regulator
MENSSKFLLIDDERKFVEFVEKAFLPYKKEILFISANTADLGIEIALREKPQVIALDLRMPGAMSGEGVLKKLKSDLPPTKFIVVSAWNDGQNKERILREIGVDQYFDKPISLREFLRTILGYFNVTIKQKS